MRTADAYGPSRLILGLLITICSLAFQTICDAEEDPFGVPGDELMAEQAASKPPKNPPPAATGPQPVRPEPLVLDLEMPAVPKLDEYRSVPSAGIEAPLSSPRGSDQAQTPVVPASSSKKPSPQETMTTSAGGQRQADITVEEYAFTPEQVFARALKAAEEGNVASMYQVGVCYLEGKGTPEDATKAFDWYNRAAQKNHAEAAFNVGYCYYHGIGTSRDVDKAILSFTLANMLGHAKATYALATIHYTEAKSAYDKRNAMGWFRDAAKAGSPDAMYRLSIANTYGDGVERNPSLAYGWMLQAALRGHTSAANSLGDMYKMGNGISKDSEEANRWFVESARRQDPDGLKYIEQLKARGIDWERTDLPEMLKAAQRGSFPSLPE